MARRRAEALGTPRAGPTVISIWEGAWPLWALELQPPRRICSNWTLSLGVQAGRRETAAKPSNAPAAESDLCWPLSSRHFPALASRQGAQWHQDGLRSKWMGLDRLGGTRGTSLWAEAQPWVGTSRRL